MIETGSTAAEIIREKWTNCAIVGVTGARPVSDVQIHQKSVYEGLYPLKDLSEYYDSIYSIAEGFRSIDRKRFRNLDNLLAALNAAKDDLPRLGSIVPDEIKSNFGDRSLTITISRWVRHTLIARAGFVYDVMWAATFLGLKPEVLGKVKKHIFDARYDGIFSDKSNEHWWQSKLRQLMLQKRPRARNVNIHDLGKNLPGVTKADFSVCYACKGDDPEVVGYTDEKGDTPVQLHLRCSVPHPKFERSLFFEEVRMMKSAE